MKKRADIHTKKSARKNAAKPNRLEKATSVYFASLSQEALKEENRLGAAMASAARHVDFDADC
jgi:hypothetical protein